MKGNVSAAVCRGEIAPPASAEQAFMGEKVQQGFRLEKQRGPARREDSRGALTGSGGGLGAPLCLSTYFTGL